MMSVLQALVGLTGLLGSVLLTLGLVNEPARQDSPDPVPTPAVIVETMTDGPAPARSAEPIQAEPDAGAPTPPSESWRGSLASVLSEPDSTGADLLRVCRVTAYCDRGRTASGVPSGLGQCAAPADIPFGSKVYVPALDKTFVVTDRTHRRFRRSTVDIFLPTKKQCRQFGRRFLDCEFTLPEGATTH